MTTFIGPDGLDGDTSKTIYEDLSIIHGALPEDWRARLVEIIRMAQLVETRPTLRRWEADHGYRNR